MCNAVGVHEGSTAELAVALLLASQREIDAFARERHEWNRRFTASLLDRRIMLLGYGGIGVEVEKRLEGFEAELVRVAGHRREDERGVVHGNDELARAPADRRRRRRRGAAVGGDRRADRRRVPRRPA